MTPAPWWSTYFDERYLLEYDPLFSLERDLHDVARLFEVPGLPLGAQRLDVGFGQGRHAPGHGGAGLWAAPPRHAAPLLGPAPHREL